MMNVEIYNVEGVSIVKPLSARIDASVSTEFKGRLIDLINNGNTLIIINLNNVNFIDSSGLGIMISIFKILKEKGKLAFCEIKSPVMQLFALTRTDKIFKIYNLESEALKALCIVK